MERRVRDFRSEIQNGGRPSINRVEDAGLRTDEYLIRYYPDNTRELRPPDGNFTFVEEETLSYDFEYDAIKKQGLVTLRDYFTEVTNPMVAQQLTCFHHQPPPYEPF